MEVIIRFIEAISILFFYNVLLKRVADSKSRTIFSDWKIYCILASIATIIYTYANKIGVNSIGVFSFVSLLYAISLCKINNIKFFKNMILVAVSVIMTFISEIPPTILAVTVFKNKDLPLMFFMILILAMIILNILILDKFLCAKVDLIVKVIKKYSWINLIILNCLIYFLFMKILKEYDFINASIVLQLTGMNIVLILSNIFYMANLYKNRHREKQEEIKININPLIDELLNKMKAREHEYKNHLNILYCMIQVCKHDELKDRAKAYIGNITEDNLLSKVTNIENTIVKAILFSKLREAEKAEIDYSFEIDSDLNTIPFDESELTIILSNLLNNAIEATSEIENRKLNIYIGQEGKEHIIKVENSTRGMSDDMLLDIFKEGFSTKGDNRGYGLYNIKSIVDKYKGKIKLSLKDDMLEFLITV